VEVVASLSQGRTAAAQCGLFTHKSVPVIFEPPCTQIFASLRVDSMKLPNSAGVAQSVLCLYCRLVDRDSVPDTGKGFLLLTFVHTGSSTSTTSNQTDKS